MISKGAFMPRSNWKGTISFGLVSIPIMLYPAENKSADISFHQIDKRDNARIKYQRINANTGKIVPWDDIGRGYEYDKETIIPVPDEVLKKVAGDEGRTIEIETFINKKELNFLMFSRNYYLVPDKNGNKGYVLLREALEEMDKIGIARVIISTKKYLAAVIPDGEGLILSLLRYDNEIKKITEFELPSKKLEKYKITKKEMEMAKQLIKSMSSKWQPANYTDDYQAAIHQWVEESVNQLPHQTPKKRKMPAGQMVNFVDLLKKSLATPAKNKKTANKNSPKKISPAHKMSKTKSKVTKHLTRH